MLVGTVASCKQIATGSDSLGLRFEVLYHLYGGEDLTNVLGQIRMFDAVLLDGGMLPATFAYEILIHQYVDATVIR